MKIDRLIGILSILLQKDKVTARELAETFEVSRRTIVRDIEDISKAGIPIVTTQGQGGGISIMEGFRLDRTLLSSADMKSILAGLQSLDSVSGTNRYRQLMDKLSVGRSGVRNADNHLIIDLSSWDKSAVSDKIELIQTAMEQGEKISFSYYAPGGDSQREMEPYHLIFQWSSWYVWGYCTLRQDYRMFKLTRMADLKCTGEPCESRDVPEYVCDKLLHTKGEIEAVVWFDKSVKWRVIDEFGTELPQFDEDGNALLRFTWSDVPSFYQYILTFGAHAEIISPEVYRKEFGALLHRMTEKYRVEKHGVSQGGQG
ncbi:YafY family protein [uncultured Ruminococcus sp.]|uniref:helix-turn-helix transcriptional regulator n=1 Tax=uncultured Ruminococcus sp. TaxID=165186 RepID=UPI002619C050|nr:YafY family protein [uncultured Ruminococcus sp.]